MDEPKEHERLNNAVKARFAEALNRHVFECPICIMRGPGDCEVGKILWLCAIHGVNSAAHMEKKDGTPP